MRFLNGRFKNFRSFKGEQVFQFPEDPGLYLMRGINEVEPRLGGNAVGKSTIWDALFWVLFDKTTRGLRAGDVCNWDAEKGTVVEFDFVLDDYSVSATIWTVRRTWGPNSWTLRHISDQITDEEVIDLAKETDNPVLQWLRLEAEPLLQSILMAQGRPMFLDLKQEPQAALFSDVLGLERWMGYASLASSKASAQDGVIRDQERLLAKLEGELESLARQDFSKAHDDWEVERLRRLLEVKADFDAGLKRRKALKEALERAKERETAARAALGSATPGKESQEALREAQRRHREVEDELLHEKRSLSALEAHVVEVREKGACPTCGQGLSKDAQAKEVERALRVIEAVESVIRKLKAEEETRWLDVEDMLRESNEEERTHDAARQELENAGRELAAARRDFDVKERELDRLEDRSEEIEEEENPYAGMQRKAKAQVAALQEDLRALRRQLDASQERYGLLTYWARGFKEIRLQEIAEALSELEIEVNSAVTALGLVDWELRFQVDKETKGGGLRRGFNVLVRSPHNPRPTPWEAWSGGEGQRLRLAANAGLSDLIRSRKGTTLNLEVWDEPTNGLSPEGIRDLLEFLAERARNEQRQIFIVDHRAFDFGGFAGTATIVKAPSGSRIRTSW